ncbi:TAP-like protein-domain-containing protein [Abortiporus biennis]|nr:TAP-like protein-domain-containing protein [Abortiporus biennis]
MDFNVKPSEEGVTTAESTEQTPRLSKLQVAILTFGILLLALLATPYSEVLNPWPKREVTPSHSEYVHYSMKSLDYLKEPIGTLKWWKCTFVDDLPGTECGYIVVPKDYSDPNAGNVKIALGKYPATGSPRQGSVLFNPGGPGNAGKLFVTRNGLFLKTTVGADYDIIGVDPRGVGESRPRIQCFDTDFMHYNGFVSNTILDRGFDVASNLSDSDLKSIVYRQQVEANAFLRTEMELCTKNEPEDLKYISTTLAARDLEFITRTIEGENARINYFGTDYGSVLGQYLINMFPDRIGRVVLDSVIDATMWTTKQPFLLHRHQLSSTEQAYGDFVTACFDATFTQCPLARQEDSSPLAIKARIDSFIDGLYYNPTSVANLESPAVLNVGRIQSEILLSLMRPMIWPKFSKALDKAMRGDASDLLKQAIQGRSYQHASQSFEQSAENYLYLLSEPEYRNKLPAHGLVPISYKTIDIFKKELKLPETLPSTVNPPPAGVSPMLIQPDSPWYYQPDGYFSDLERQVVTCSDQARTAPPSVSDIVDELVDVYQNISKFVFAATTVERSGGCEFYPIEPVERFEGPWNQTLASPILLISNTADPITSIADGKKVTETLGASARHLIQNSPGHRSIALPSLCTTRSIRAYFRDGTLPPQGTVCEVDISPFPDAAVDRKVYTPEEEWIHLSTRILDLTLGPYGKYQ